MRQRTYLLASACAFLPYVTSPGMAQTPGNAGADEATNANVIIVTAQKREQNLQDVPLSLSVVSGEEIEQAQINDIQDLGARVPGVSISQFGGRGDVALLFVRGLGNNNATQTLRAATIIDDVPITDLRSLNNNIFDVERVEILRGPQSTLYGLTAEAGLIVIQSRRPGDEFGGDISARYTSVGDFELRGSVDIPIAPGILAVRASGLYEEIDGFVDNQLLGDDYDRGRTFAGRVRAIFTPAPDWEFDLTYAYEDGDDDYGQAFLPVDRAAYVARFSNPIAAATSDVPFTALSPLGKFENATDYRGFSEITSNNLSLRASFDTGPVEIVTVSAYRDFELGSSFDLGSQPGGISPFPGSPSGFFQAGESEGGIESFYQELRLVSAESDTFNWVAGVAYFDRDALNAGSFIRTTANLPSPPFPPIPADTAFRFGDTERDEFQSFSVFGQLEVTPIERLELLLGARWEDTESNSVNLGGFDGGGGLGPPSPGELADDGRRLTQSSDIFLPKFTISFVPSDELRFYASIARGWLPGSANADSAVGDDGIIDPEKSWTYELGVRFASADGAARFNGAVFRTDVDNYQEAINVGPIDILLENVASARFQGFEMDGAITVAPWLTFTGGLAYTDATYRNFIEDFGPPFGTVDRSGNRLPAVPDYNYNIAANFTFTDDLFATVELVGAGDFLERDDRSGGQGTQLAGVVLQPALGTFEGHDIVNLRIGYEFGRFELLGFINNVFDQRYFRLTSNIFAFNGPADVHVLGAPGRPFEAGVRVGFNF